jgi:2-polyprenyl-3-methyl-5-hydroxy-6-metoxy-1,4-benzoquinol methylase
MHEQTAGAQLAERSLARPEARFGISDPEYMENALVAETDLVARLYERFRQTGWPMPEAQMRMYHSIREALQLRVLEHPEYPKFVWAPKVIDVGCGCGIGSNILSQRADFVWGIDKSEEAIHFARQMFARLKNEAYWSPQVSFDVIDVTAEPRELMKFDVVVSIEVIEHLPDYRPLLAFLKRVGKPSAIYFISTPNRDAWKGTGRAKRPRNPCHVREWNAREFRELLSGEFSRVELFNCELVPVVDETTETPILARCAT